MSSPIAAVMIHVSTVGEAYAWYQKAFHQSILEEVESHSYKYLNLAGVRIEIVQADSKVQAGAAGSVVY
jgi:uncharacterized protein